MDLEKAYDRADRKGVWAIMKIFEAGVGREACLRVDKKENI